MGQALRLSRARIRHSITSSASASERGRHDQSSALAVLRLMTKVNLSLQLNRQIGGRSALEHAIDVIRNSTMGIGQIAAIRHQPAIGDENPERIDCGHPCCAASRMIEARLCRGDDIGEDDEAAGPASVARPSTPRSISAVAAKRHSDRCDAQRGCPRTNGASRAHARRQSRDAGELRPAMFWARISLSWPSHLLAISPSKLSQSGVALPPGCARLCTKPAPNRVGDGDEARSGWWRSHACTAVSTGLELAKMHVGLKC